MNCLLLGLSFSFLCIPYIGDTVFKLIPNFVFFCKSASGEESSADGNVFDLLLSEYVLWSVVSSIAYVVPLAVPIVSGSPNKAPLNLSFASPIPFPRACLPIVVGLPPPVCFKNLPTSEPFFPYKSCVIGVCESFLEPSPFLFDSPSITSFTTSVGINSFGIPNLSFILSLRPATPPSTPSFESPFPTNPPPPCLPPVPCFIVSNAGVLFAINRVASLP